MLALLFYYLILPVMIGALLIRVIQRAAPRPLPEPLRRLYESHPIAPKYFRAARLEGSGEQTRAVLIGDFETLPEAVDAIYAACESARAQSVKAAFFALNDRMEPLEEVDS